MAITTRIRNRFDNDTVYAVIRMDAKTHKALKVFMHCKDPLFIRFSHGVKLAYRGRGWYRVDASNSLRGVEKVEGAMKAIRAFIRDEERKTDEALKRFAPIMKDPELKIVSFSNAHSEGEYGYAGIMRPEDNPTPKTVSLNKLQALANKFQRPNNKAH